MGKDQNKGGNTPKEGAKTAQTIGEAVAAPAAGEAVAAETAAPAMSAEAAAKAAQDAKETAKKAAEDAKAAAKAAAEEARALRIAKATPIAAPAALTDLIEGQKYNLTMQSPMTVFSKKLILATDKPSRMGGKGVQVEVQILAGTEVASVKKPGSSRIFYTTKANLDTTPAPEAPAPAAVPATEEAKEEEVAGN
jgi:hypothetical protein